MTLPEEDQEDARGELLDLLGTAGWELAREGLGRRIAAVKYRLARGKKLDLEEIRELQVTYEVLAKLLQEPLAFFGFRGRDERRKG